MVQAVIWLSEWSIPTDLSMRASVSVHVARPF